MKQVPRRERQREVGVERGVRVVGLLDGRRRRGGFFALAFALTLRRRLLGGVAAIAIALALALALGGTLGLGYRSRSPRDRERLGEGVGVVVAAARREAEPNEKLGVVRRSRFFRVRRVTPRSLAVAFTLGSTLALRGDIALALTSPSPSPPSASPSALTSSSSAVFFDSSSSFGSVGGGGSGSHDASVTLNFTVNVVGRRRNLHRPSTGSVRGRRARASLRPA